MIEGLIKCLGTILVYTPSLFFSTKTSIYKLQRKLTVFYRYAQFLSNSVNQSVQVVNYMALVIGLAIAKLADSVDHTRSTETGNNVISAISKMFFILIIDQ